MYYSQEIMNEIFKKTDIKHIVSEYTKLRYEKGIYTGKCPFHNENTYNLIVDARSQTYQCLSCGRGGNVINFIMEIKKIDFKSAVEYLSNKVGVFIPEINMVTSEEKQREKLIVSRINREAAKYYYYNLSKPGNEGMAYFRNRQLSDATIKKFGLGYAGGFGSGLYKHLVDCGFTDADISNSGLVGYGVNYSSGKHEFYDKFWDRVIFPIINNTVVGFGGRVLNDGKPKYLNSPETAAFDKGKTLYGYNFAKNSKNDYIILCEGFMDVIALHQAGFDTAVASLGTALTQGQADLISAHTKNVFLAYDGDMPGIKAAMRALPILESKGITTKILHLGTCKDPDEFIKTHGVNAFNDVLASAESGDHFKFRALKMQCENQEEFFDAASELLMNYLK